MPNQVTRIRPMGAIASAITRLQSQLYAAPPNTITGVDSQNWPSALQPVQPIAPAGSSPLGFNFWTGQNLNYTPRPDAEFSAADLKTLATYPLARICIDNTKDTLTKIPWSIQLRAVRGETKKDLKNRSKGDKNIIALSRFFERPDPEHDWQEWLRPLIEDMLVIDAASIYVRRQKRGPVAELRVMRGDMFARYIDDNGFTPAPPSPAYAQLWEGIPRVNLTTDQLIYRPRNIVPRNTVSSQLYGMSPTETIASEIQVGMGRLAYVNAFYQTGSIPNMIQLVPPGITPERIREAEQSQNSALAGNLAARRQLRLMQGWLEDGKDQIIQPKEPTLADAFDDLHIRKIAFAYGTSAQRLMKQMNRASADAGQEAAEEEGTEPYALWMKALMDYIIQRTMGFSDYEFALNLERESDALKRMETSVGYVGHALRTINEDREDRGEDPRQEPEADELGILTPTGWVRLGTSTQPDPNEDSNSGESPDAPKGKQPTPKKLLKLADQELRIDPNDDVHTRSFRGAMQAKLSRFFGEQREAAAKRAAAVVDKPARTKKADQPSELPRRLIEAIAAFDWNEIVPSVEESLYESGLAGALKGLAQVQISSSAAIVTAQKLAREFAHERAAEMVGMKWNSAGDLIANPNAKWAISDTTRDQIRTLVEDAFAKETPIAELIESIRESAAFSDARAKMIAVTEVARAQSQANLGAWQRTGVVQTARWVVSSIHVDQDDCDDNVDAGPVPIGELFPSGVACPPDHPACMCHLVAVDIAKPAAVAQMPMAAAFGAKYLNGEIHA